MAQLQTYIMMQGRHQFKVIPPKGMDRIVIFDGNVGRCYSTKNNPKAPDSWIANPMRTPYDPIIPNADLSAHKQDLQKNLSGLVEDKIVCMNEEQWHASREFTKGTLRGASDASHQAGVAHLGLSFREEALAQGAKGVCNWNVPLMGPHDLSPLEHYDRSLDYLPWYPATVDYTMPGAYLDFGGDRDETIEKLENRILTYRALFPKVPLILCTSPQYKRSMIPAPLEWIDRVYDTAEKFGIDKIALWSNVTRREYLTPVNEALAAISDEIL